MHATPKQYAATNTFQTQDATDSINTIKAKYPDRFANILLYISPKNSPFSKSSSTSAAGPEKVTDILKDTFPTSKVIAIDIDPLMIDFAKNNFRHQSDAEDHPVFGKISENNNSMEYFISDFSQPWYNIAPELQAFEGPAVFGEPEETWELVSQQVQQGIQINFKYRFGAEASQQERWRDELNRNDVSDVDIEILVTRWEIPKPEDLVTLVNICRSWYLKYVQNDSLDGLGEDEKEKFMQEMYDAVEKAHSEEKRNSMRTGSRKLTSIC
ncbi:Malonyl-[acyl-carrier protein] O-methyltransferase [Folsomia candida]|uniref:Malonyl-[acyl-carrier protein] O-methyltransferase n=1 Tax=Folsomia candida TaxID=158441 RepID=A0A226CW82_FOLCA|nr:Malonyl-[acyl-carrier protein] O-methyltransferase [Folsomia candida]